MNKQILTLSLALIGVAAFAGSGFAQGYPPRVDAARFAVETTREYRGDRAFQADRDFGREHARTGYLIERLNREVRRLGWELRRSGAGPRLHQRYDLLHRNADRLTAHHLRGRIRGWEARRRADQLLAEAHRIRAILRGRHIGIGGGWR
ncbi:MAG TPA: hypothetical protein VG095_06505 [Chthoniobacterales bacterium]|nr:hypothetical protein [Chthoniobacterales bacterium]